jgi:hypothetical protein
VTTQNIFIPPITLEWSDWHSWPSIMVDGRSGGVYIPNERPGVYEARLVGAAERLTIGKATDLRRRVRMHLVKGKAKHSSGDDIRRYEDTTQVEVRWAETDRPAAVEEDLHRQYRKTFGCLPKYTDH